MFNWKTIALKGVFGAGLMAGALAFGTPAMAETLQIHGVYPAGNGDAAEISSIGVREFGGIDGPMLSIKVADALRNATIDGQSYFNIGPASLLRGADAVLSGSVSTDVDIRRATAKEVTKCVKRDDKNKCIERRKVQVRCQQMHLSARPTLRLVSANGRLIHSDNEPVSRQLRFCADQARPSVDPMVEELLNEIATRLRFALAPQQRVEDVRVLETRKGMDKGPGNDFRDAIRMTKSDEGVACDAFVGLEPTIGEHVSLLFNIGLCAEARGDFDTASDYYRRAIQADPSKSYAGEGLERIRQRIRAEQQLEVHYGGY